MSIQTLQELQDERDALRAEVERLKSKTWCAYCGQEYELDDECASKIGEHIRTCEKHPLRMCEAENEKARSRDARRLELENLGTAHAAALLSLKESSSAQLQTARDEIATLQSDAAQSNEVGACSMRACGCAQRRVRLRCAGSPQAKESARC
jgi:hypothetical protein